MSVKQDALDELVTEQELLLMDMLKNWNDIRTRLANIEPNNPMNEMFDKMIQDLVKIQQLSLVAQPKPSVIDMQLCAYHL